jgi:hypothetical protein
MHAVTKWLARCLRPTTIASLDLIIKLDYLASVAVPRNAEIMSAFYLECHEMRGNTGIAKLGVGVSESSRA